MVVHLVRNEEMGVRFSHSPPQLASKALLGARHNLKSSLFGSPPTLKLRQGTEKSKLPFGKLRVAKIFLVEVLLRSSSFGRALKFLNSRKALVKKLLVREKNGDNSLKVPRICRNDNLMGYRPMGEDELQ